MGELKRLVTYHEMIGGPVSTRIDQPMDAPSASNRPCSFSLDCKASRIGKTSFAAVPAVQLGKCSAVSVHWVILPTLVRQRTVG